MGRALGKNLLAKDMAPKQRKVLGQNKKKGECGGREMLLLGHNIIGNGWQFPYVKSEERVSGVSI